MGVSTSAILVFFGFVPSLSWLGFYLKKDIHPEPKYLVSRTFLMGIILAPLAVIAQWLFREFVPQLFPGYGAMDSVWFFLWAAFIEEVVKFLAVRFIVVHDPEFDEPIDAMIYMVVAGLGFAAIENVLVLFQTLPRGTEDTIQTWLLRFAGATLLHAVSSAIVGYFLALSWFYNRHSSKLITLGILIATIFHFVFNVSLLAGGGSPASIVYSAIFLIFTAAIVSVLLAKLKNAAAKNQF